MLVARIIRMHCHRRIAEHRLGSGGRHDDSLVAALDRVGEMPEVTLDVPVHHFEVGKGRVAAGTPGDQPLAAVDQPLVVEVLEGAANRARRSRVHREGEARPVARCAEDPHLLADPAAILVHVFPDAFDEFLAAEIVPGQPFLRNQPLDHPLAGDAGVVGAGQPERRVTEHAVPPDHDVLDRDEERVADVQLAGDVRRRHDDDERFSVSPIRRLKVSRRIPLVVETLLNLLGVERRRQLHRLIASCHHNFLFWSSFRPTYRF